MTPAEALLLSLLADLAAEGAALDAVVAPLDRDEWRTATPSPGWTVAHQVAHLAWTDELAVLAARAPEELGARRLEGTSGGSVVDAAAEQGAAQEPAVLLERWRAGRAAVGEALAAVPAGGRLPWFGPPMSASSMATARLMETWAHGVDVTDALGLPVSATARLRHVAHLGVRTRAFAHVQHGLPPPAHDVRVELTGPDGELWTWGPEDAAQRVTGPALHLCLRVTQRRHRDDLALVATGAEADRWLDLAQAFAGAPGAGRPPVSAR